MYAETLERYASERDGAVTVEGRRPVGDGSTVAGGVVRAVLFGDNGSAYRVLGYEDREEAGKRAHVRRLLVQVDSRLTESAASGELEGAERTTLAQETLDADPFIDVTAAYFIEGGRELKALLECRQWESKGQPVDTPWWDDLGASFEAYHRGLELEQDAREAVMAYNQTTGSVDEDIDADEVTSRYGNDLDGLPEVETTSVLSTYGSSTAEEAAPTIDPDRQAALERYAALGAAIEG